jgi:hypothetical protein
MALQNRRIKNARNQQEADSKQSLVHAGVLQPRRLRRNIPPKRRLTFSRLHGFMSQTTKFFTQKTDTFYTNYIITSP